MGLHQDLSLPKWEYLVLPQPKASTLDEITAWLNELGAQGWQLCHGDYGAFIFIRPVWQH